MLMEAKKYNEAIVYLKRLETTADYKVHYSFAVANLIKAYNELNMPDEILKYADIIKTSEITTPDEKNGADLFVGKAYLLKADTVQATKAFDNVVANTKTIAAAEAKYNLAKIQYSKKDYKNSQKTCFDLINNMPSFDYWVAKSFILLADNYIALKDKMQAKSTLMSIIDNYDGKDDIIPTAKQKLESIK
jgi:tetratricopeptide (TPR) repeat protein